MTHGPIDVFCPQCTGSDPRCHLCGAPNRLSRVANGFLIGFGLLVLIQIALTIVAHW